MPIDNLAKIFGPTILGYSCADPDHHAILSETMVQKDVSGQYHNIRSEGGPFFAMHAMVELSILCLSLSGDGTSTKYTDGALEASH